MASKLGNLQSALNTTRSGSPAVVELSRPAAVPPATPPQRQSNRQGKVNLAAWLDPAFKSSLRMVQAQRGGTIQQLLEEGLNDLFRKYDVPTVTTGD
jgi:hypothetical protein